MKKLRKIQTFGNFETTLNKNPNFLENPKRLENSQLLRKTCVANYYEDSTISKQFLNFPRL